MQKNKPTLFFGYVLTCLLYFILMRVFHSIIPDYIDAFFSAFLALQISALCTRYFFRSAQVVKKEAKRSLMKEILIVLVMLNCIMASHRFMPDGMPINLIGIILGSVLSHQLDFYFFPQPTGPSEEKEA